MNRVPAVLIVFVAPPRPLLAYLSGVKGRHVCVDGQLTFRRGHALTGPDAGAVAAAMGLPEDRRYSKGRWNVWPEEVAAAERAGAVRRRKP